MSVLPFPVLINRAFLIFFAVFRVAGIFDLQIVYTELLSTELTDILVIGIPEQAVAFVIQIIASCHNAALHFYDDGFSLANFSLKVNSEKFSNYNKTTQK